MSGGHWEYIYFRIEEIAKELNPDKSKEEIHLGKLLLDLSEVLHDCEWYYSGDYSTEQFIKTWNKFKEKWLK